MKFSLTLTPLVFCLFGFGLNNNLLTSSAFSFGFEASTSEATTNTASTTTVLLCNVPTEPYTTNVTETAATFNWTAVSGAQNYSVQTRLPNGAWSYVSGSPFANTWVTVNGLSPGTTYEWRVRANCTYGDQSYWTSPVSFTTSGSSSCNAPSSLYTLNITQTSATWDWSSVSGAYSYSVQWRYAGGTWYDLPGGPWTATVLNVGGLQSSTDYEWRVRSNCSYGTSSPWSNSASFTTLASSCYTPENPYTTNITGTTATFNWSLVSGAESYSVQTRLPNGTWAYVPGSPFTNTSVTIGGFNPNTTYEWRVRAKCGYGNYSNWTYPITFTTSDSYTCEAPDYLYTANITQTSATLDWSSVSGAESYSLQYRLSGGTWYDVSGGPWTNSWYTLTGLQPGTAYEWRVRSHCSYGSYSPWSYSASFSTLGSSCYTPGYPFTTNITASTATFNWSSVSGAQNYSVQQRLPNGTWYDVPGSPVANTWVTVYGLNANTTYEWRVKANCGYGNYSNWTYPVSFTTSGTSCQAPGYLYTVNITQTSATFDWSSVSGAVSYSLQYRIAGGTWYDVNGGPWTSSWYTITGLQPGTTYEWRVRSNCADGAYSPWSYNVSFTTLSGSCQPPSNLYTTNITGTTATLNWTAVSGAQSYSVQIRLPNGSWYYVPGSPFYNTSVTVDALSPGTTYEWRVRTNCSYGYKSYWSYPVSFTTSGSYSCNAPSSLYTLNITQTSATWDWTSVSGAYSYSVQWRYAGGTWYTLPGGPWSGTLLNVSGLQSGTAYEWRVRSNCADGIYSAWSNGAAFTTLENSCGTPAYTNTTNITSTTATLNWSAVSGAQNYSVQTRLPNGPWYYVPGSPFANTSVTIDWLSPGTTYEWRVRANCGYGNQSYWTSPISFTTSGGSGNSNDHCSDATLLSVSNTCLYSQGSNIGATPSTPSPSGGCPSYGYKDVWFRFTMPDVMNPTVTIRTTAGSLHDAVMEVYVGDNCSTLSYLTCEDDNTNGNNSSMPVVNLIGYPNAMIWVRVWGYGGSTGTFNICVFDYQSNSLGADDSQVTPIAEEQFIELNSAPNEAQTQKDEDSSPILQVAPNPVSDVLYVTFLQTETCIVSGLVLNDISGKIVVRKEYQSENFLEFKEELDMSELTPGIYILHLITTTGILSEKVSVMTR